MRLRPGRFSPPSAARFPRRVSNRGGLRAWAAVAGLAIPLMLMPTGTAAARPAAAAPARPAAGCAARAQAIADALARAFPRYGHSRGAIVR